MGRIRTIKPEFFTSESVSELPLRARLTWIGLWTQCDDHGRTRDNVKLVKAAVWPLDDVSLRDVDEDLQVLAAKGRIIRYEVGGKNYLVIKDWDEHQAAAYRRGEPKYPAPPEPSPVVVPPERPVVQKNAGRTTGDADSTGSRAGTGNREQGTGIAPSKPTRKADELWDAVLVACGVNGEEIPKSARGAYNTAVADLRNIGATPAQVTLRARKFRTQWPKVTLTPTALSRRWPELNGHAVDPGKPDGWEFGHD